MCGFFGHGFYWKEDNNYVVVFDLEINSHSGQRIARPEIPSWANRCGFDPIDGSPLTNDNCPLPDEVKTKIGILFDMYFPDATAIARWMRYNYGKNNDAFEWHPRMPAMLDRALGGYFTQEYYNGSIEYYKRSIEYYKGKIEYYKGKIEDYKGRIEGSTGTHDNIEINSFCDYFVLHPNEYWAERKMETAVEYQSYVRA